MKKISIMFLFFTITTFFAQKKFTIDCYKIKPSLFRNNLNNILDIEKKWSKKNSHQIDYDIHLLKFKKKKENVYSITIERLKYIDIPEYILNSKKMGIFKIKNEKFIVYNYLDKIFKKTKRKTSIEIHQSKNDLEYHIYPMPSPDWGFLLIDNNLILEEGLLW